MFVQATQHFTIKMSSSGPKEGQDMKLYPRVAFGYSDAENGQISRQMSCTFAGFDVYTIDFVTCF